MMEDRSTCSRVCFRFCGVSRGSHALQASGGACSLLAEVRLVHRGSAQDPAKCPVQTCAVSAWGRAPASRGAELSAEDGVVSFALQHSADHGDLPVLHAAFRDLANPLSEDEVGALIVDLADLSPAAQRPHLRCRPLSEGEAFCAFHCFARLCGGDRVAHLLVLMCYGEDAPPDFSALGGDWAPEAELLRRGHDPKKLSKSQRALLWASGVAEDVLEDLRAQRLCEALLVSRRAIMNALSATDGAAAHDRCALEPLREAVRRGVPQSLARSAALAPSATGAAVRVSAPLVVPGAGGAAVALYGVQCRLTLSGGKCVGHTRKSHRRFSELERLAERTASLGALCAAPLAPLPPKSWRSHLPPQLNSNFFEARRSGIERFLSDRLDAAVRLLHGGSRAAPAPWEAAAAAVLAFLGCGDLCFACVPRALPAWCLGADLLRDTRGALWLLVGGGLARLRDAGAPAYGALCRVDGVASWARLGGSEGAYRLAEKAFAQIDLDLQRTAARGSAERLALGRVLRSFALLLPRVGYCQAMNFVALFLLRELCHEEERGGEGLPEEALRRVEPLCFELMVSLATFCLPLHWVPSMAGVQVDMRLLKTLLRLRHPRCAQTLEGIGLPLEFFASQWMLTLFATCLPRAVSSRVLDLVFTARRDALVFVSLVLLASAMRDGHLSPATDASAAAKAARAAVKRFHDGDALVFQAEAERAACLAARPGLRELRALHARHVAARGEVRRRSAAVRELCAALKGRGGTPEETFLALCEGCARDAALREAGWRAGPDGLRRVFERAGVLRGPAGARARREREPGAAGELLDALFRAYDGRGAGEIDVQMVLFAWAMGVGNSVDDRLACLFRACDLDGDGRVDLGDLSKLLRCVLVANDAARESVEDRVASVLRGIPPAPAGISLDDFRDLCRRHPTLLRQIAATVAHKERVRAAAAQPRRPPARAAAAAAAPQGGAAPGAPKGRPAARGDRRWSRAPDDGAVVEVEI